MLLVIRSSQLAHVLVRFGMAAMLKRPLSRRNWLMPLPNGMDMRQSMIFGTAGITAVYGLQALERQWADP